MTNITAERLRELLSYNPDTGVCRWLPVPSGRIWSALISAGTRFTLALWLGALTGVAIEHNILWNLANPNPNYMLQ